jgi:hypothetical protein
LRSHDFGMRNWPCRLNGRYVIPTKLHHAWKFQQLRYTRVVPSIRIAGPYDVYFTSHDRGEPPHVHVDRENMTAKLWLSSVSVAFNLGFSRHELRRIERLIGENREACLKAWYEYFGT